MKKVFEAMTRKILNKPEVSTIIYIPWHDIRNPVGDVVDKVSTAIHYAVERKLYREREMIRVWAMMTAKRRSG